ncbi:MAG: ATP synthase subunit delta [Phycisphaerae bacterium]|nr:ATP synthase subunit delta [Phycisphaerae bacterium]
MATAEQQTIAEVYALSLLDLAKTQNAALAIDQEFQELVQALGRDSDFRTLFSSPLISEEVRAVTLDRLFRGRLSDLLLNTLQVLNLKGRINLLEEVQHQYHQEVVELQNVTEVRVSSATALSAGLRQQLVNLLQQRCGRNVAMIEEIDPALLGGLLIHIEDQKVDLSVAHQLDRFYETMITHAQQHIHAGTDLFEQAEKY